MVLRFALHFPVFVDRDQRILVGFHNVVGHTKFILFSVDSELLQWTWCHLFQNSQLKKQLLGMQKHILLLGVSQVSSEFCEMGNITICTSLLVWSYVAMPGIFAICLSLVDNCHDTGMVCLCRYWPLRFLPL